MEEYIYFKQSGHPEITAAIAGISKMDWIFASSDDPLEKVVETMQHNRFDILPIQEKDKSYKSYYTTTHWGRYEAGGINKIEIQLVDKLNFLTPLHDTLMLFGRNGRKFYFLDNGIQILGLLTISNLNCKQVYLYLYHLIIQMEQALGAFIYKSGLTDAELLQIIEARVASPNALDVVSRFQQDQQKGLDYKFIEYVYLSDLSYIITKAGLTNSLNLSNKDFKSILFKINEIRLIVAHPNKSLIRNNEAVKTLYNALVGMDLLLQKVNEALK